MREEVWAIVRAAVEEAMGPLVVRQRELEARVERAERERGAEGAKGAQTAAKPPPPAAAPAAQPSGGGGASAASRLASIGPVGGPSSIPVAFGPSLAPPTLSLPQAAVPLFESEAAGATLPDIDTAAAAPVIREKTSAHPVGPRPSIPVGYGVSVVVAPRASLDLESVGPVDVEGFDGGRAKKRVASIVVVMMLLLIAGLVTMTVLSHN